MASWTNGLPSYDPVVNFITRIRQEGADQGGA